MSKRKPAPVKTASMPHENQAFLEDALDKGCNNEINLIDD